MQACSTGTKMCVSCLECIQIFNIHDQKHWAKQTTAHFLMRLSLIKSGLLRWGWLWSTVEHYIAQHIAQQIITAWSYNSFIIAPLKHGSIISGVASVAMLAGWNDIMISVIWSWAWCNLIGLSLHIKQRDGRGRNVETGEEKTDRSGEGREKDMEIKEGREERNEGRVMTGTDGKGLDGKGEKWRKT